MLRNSDAVHGRFAEYNEWKRKQEEEERKLAEQYGMPYGEEVGDVQE